MNEAAARYLHAKGPAGSRPLGDLLPREELQRFVDALLHDEDAGEIEKSRIILEGGNIREAISRS